LQEDLSRAEREQFVDWLRASSVHVAEMLRMAEVHGALERFRDWVRVPTEGASAPDNVVAFEAAGERPDRAHESPDRAQGTASRAHDPPDRAQGTAGRADELPDLGQGAPHWAQESSGPRTRRWAAGAALAATVAALAVFLTLFFSAQVIETGRAERRSVTLADGSVLQIDPESRLRIRLRKQERDISLEHGRALFRVAHDTARPFIVHAGAAQVRAVGTQFGVEEAREGVVVTVAEGKVAVLPRDASAAPDTVSRNPGHDEAGRGALSPTAGRSPAELLLSAGQQVIVPRRGPAEAVRTVDTDRELAWVAGRLVFDNESVGDVVEEFNRYNVVQLHVASPGLAQRSVSGVFDASEPESFIRFMQSVAPVNVRRAGQDITIALAP
jgi:transmembrane sensor